MASRKSFRKDSPSPERNETPVKKGKRKASASAEESGSPNEKKARIEKEPTKHPLEYTQAELLSDNPKPIYNRMLSYWDEEARNEKSRPFKRYAIHETKESSAWITTAQVHTAIASVTYAKPEVNGILDYKTIKHYPYAHHYMTAKYYEEKVNQKRVDKLNTKFEAEREVWPIPGLHRLIIPWQSENHFICVVVERGEKKGVWHEWSSSYMDSLPKGIAAAELGKLTDALVIMLQDLGWFDKWKIDPDLLINHEMRRIPAGRQSGGTCGMHTIMNAWAAALGLTLNPNFYSADKASKIPGGETGWWSVAAAHMVNLAIMGRMNAVTIYMFFRTWNFIEVDEEVDPAISSELDFERTVDVGTGQGRSLRMYKDFVEKEG